MLGIQLCLRTSSGFGALIDQEITNRSFSNSLCCSSLQSSFKLGFRTRRSHGAKSFIICCKAGRFSGKSDSNEERNDDYLEAFIMDSEIFKHHQLRKQGFLEETEWQSYGQILPYPIHEKGSKADVSSIRHGFLHRFQSPTIFLKIACNGEWFLPIIVGEFALEKLIDAFRGNENGDSLNHYQFVKNLISKLGYEVKMVRITERVVNTYYARIFFGKPGEKAILSVDARPSDAINVAMRCKVPIYVRKQIVLTDAIRVVYGMQRGNGAKVVYDVSLDSAVEGPDTLTEELDLVRNMNIAVAEERYNDAALLRDKLTKLRTITHDL
ncbi:bifunctional nuclease 2 isoform X1 [Macadamia integrifolia]|uniref:bifunctional nuclease 2 isoform X1 n=1 Tax=Macadamia integrifolia TaxID=60698 RepID=UPI001C4FC5E8|nr:bifunctional nuclease 2 isoform X1 [Macadamia integrifolia]